MKQTGHGSLNKYHHWNKGFVTPCSILLQQVDIAAEPYQVA